MRCHDSFSYSRFLSIKTFLRKLQNKIYKLWQHPNHSRENIHVKVWYQLSWNYFFSSLSSSHCLLGNYSFIFGLFGELQLKLKVFNNWTWLFSAKVLKFCQLRVVNSFIQQRFSLWCKVNWKENFLKFRPLVYLEPAKLLWWSSI